MAGTIAGAKLKPNTLTGTQIREASLGEVPRAQTARSAQSATMAATATTATKAADAARLNGIEPSPPFKPLALESGCRAVAGFAPPGYYIDAFRVVHLRGAIGGCDHPRFTLPEEARPSYILHFAVPNNGSGDELEVYISEKGAGTTASSGNSFGVPSLDGITFRLGD